MRPLRSLALALISFVAVLLGTFLSPGTWLHRAISLSLCGLLSFNSTLCTVNSIQSAEEANAINQQNLTICQPYLQVRAAQPAQSVLIAGIPDSFTELSASYTAKDTDQTFYTPIIRSGNGSVAVAVPFHPVNHEGGNIDIRISGNGQNCPPVSLNISKLVSVSGGTKKLLMVIGVNSLDILELPRKN